MNRIRAVAASVRGGPKAGNHFGAAAGIADTIAVGHRRRIASVNSCRVSGGRWSGAGAAFDQTVRWISQHGGGEVAHRDGLYPGRTVAALIRGAPGAGNRSGVAAVVNDGIRESDYGRTAGIYRCGSASVVGAGVSGTIECHVQRDGDYRRGDVANRNSLGAAGRITA